MVQGTYKTNSQNACLRMQSKIKTNKSKRKEEVNTLFENVTFSTKKELLKLTLYKHNSVASILHRSFHFLSVRNRRLNKTLALFNIPIKSQ